MSVGQKWENETRPPVLKHRRPLTHSLDLTEEGSAVKATCSIDGCDKVVNGWGWCVTHYRRWQKHGDPLRGRRSVAERFERMVDKTDTCWIWTGSTGSETASGFYGQMYVDGRLRAAHRVSYELHIGPIPDGMVVDHRCHNSLCVRPEHLRSVTQGQNMQNRVGAQRNSKSGVLGVSWATRDKRWKAEVTLNGRHYSAGHYTDLADAERAVVALRLKLFTHNDRDRQTEVPF